MKPVSVKTLTLSWFSDAFVAQFGIVGKARDAALLSNNFCSLGCALCCILLKRFLIGDRKSAAISVCL